MKMAVVLLLAAKLAGCSNPITSDEKEKRGASGPIYDPEPAMVMILLARALNERDKELYEVLLDDHYQFTESDCQGDLIYEYGREEEVRIMGTQDGSSQGILDIYPTIEWDFHLSRRWTVLIDDQAEYWEAFRGRVEITLLDRSGEGYHVDQMMTFKIRLGDDHHLRIVRWLDDPVCSEGDDAEAGRVLSWGSIKAPYLE